MLLRLRAETPYLLKRGALCPHEKVLYLVHSAIKMVYLLRSLGHKEAQRGAHTGSAKIIEKHSSNEDEIK